VYIAVCRNSATPLRVTHMPCGITVLPATRQRCESRLYPQPKQAINLATLEGCKAELTYVTWKRTGRELNCNLTVASPTLYRWGTTQHHTTDWLYYWHLANDVLKPAISWSLTSPFSTLNYYASAYNRRRQLSHRKTKLNQIQKKHENKY